MYRLFQIAFLVAAFQANAASKLPYYAKLSCEWKEDVVTTTKKDVTFTYNRNVAPDEIYDLFEVPKINREAYERIQLSVTLPLENCKMPQGFSLDLQCESKTEIEVTLKGSTKWDPVYAGKFDYEHKITLPVSFQTSLNQKKKKEGELMRSVLFDLSLGRTKWTSPRDIWPVEMGKSNLCVVDDFFEIN